MLGMQLQERGIRMTDYTKLVKELRYNGVEYSWWDENGERHDEDGFTMPEMKLFKGDVEEFFNGSERSAGWVSYQE